MYSQLLKSGKLTAENPKVHRPDPCSFGPISPAFLSKTYNSPHNATVTGEPRAIGAAGRGTSQEPVGHMVGRLTHAHGRAEQQQQQRSGWAEQQARPDFALLETLAPLQHLPSLASVASHVEGLERRLRDTQCHLEALACLSSLASLASLGAAAGLPIAALSGHPPGYQHHGSVGGASAASARSGGSSRCRHIETRRAVEAQPVQGQTHQNMWGQAGALSGTRSSAMMDSQPGSDSRHENPTRRSNGKDEGEGGSAGGGTAYVPSSSDYGQGQGLLRPTTLGAAADDEPPLLLSQCWPHLGTPALQVDLLTEHAKGMVQHMKLAGRLTSSSARVVEYRADVVPSKPDPPSYAVQPALHRAPVSLDGQLIPALPVPAQPPSRQATSSGMASRGDGLQEEAAAFFRKFREVSSSSTSTTGVPPASSRLRLPENMGSLRMD